MIGTFSYLDGKGFLDLTDAEWDSVENLITEKKDLLKINNEPILQLQS